MLDQWFSCRRRNDAKPMIGDRRPPSPLEKIDPNGRLVALEPRQADLLDRIVAGPLVPLAAGREPGTTGAGPS